eukprot:c22902_g1_i1 orf=394-4026(-)
MAMEELYPEELRTPPMPLAALVGLPELHSTISSYLHKESLPINTLALPDFSKIAVLAGKERKPADAKLPPPVGIFKIDWLRKHRTRVPAALIVLLGRDEVYGDPAQWLQVCTHLDNIKNVLRGRNTKLVIVIVQPTLLSGDVVEERMMTLRKRAEVDAKYFLTFISQESSELKRSLARLGNILGELMTLFYKEEGRRMKLRLEKKLFSSTELSVRYNFKVAVYAEFRRDWVEALKYYESAYTLLQEVVTTPMELQPVQRLVELKTVAEQLHFKVSTLLLHGGKEGEAVKWFRQHMSFYKPLVGPSEGNFLHWSWVSKQFLVFAVLLQNSLPSVSQTKSGSPALPEAPVTERELQPGYYYQLAAHYMIERRLSFQSTSSSFDARGEEQVDVLGGPPEEVAPPLYVGQSPRLPNRGTIQCPTDQEYMLHAIMQEKLFPHSATAINLLKRAYELYKHIQAGRMGYFVACEMGREYFNARDYINAKQLFDSVAGMYRKEAWVPLLWATLGFLRECARQLGNLREYIENSLEMAALPTTPGSDGSEQGQKGGFNRQVGPAGPLCHLQREQISLEVFKLLRGQQSVLPSREGEIGLAVVDSDPVLLNIDAASPLRAVLAVCVAFHEPTVKPGMKTCVTLSLLTHLPQALDFEELEVHFNQPTCNLVLVRETRDLEREGLDVRAGFDLCLEPNRWKRFSFDLIPGQSGKLECLTVTAHLGTSASIMCQVESPASRDDVLYWNLESQLEMMPLKDIALSCYGQKTILVEEQDPLVDLVLKAVDGPALVNELFPINISIRSKGHAVHAGEIKLSIQESSPSSVMTSPRTPLIPIDMSLVELFTLGPLRESEEPELQLFSGVLVVPAIATETDFSTQIYMRWKEAKPLSLFASFSYQTEMAAAQGHPLRFFVHRGLQLQCQDPFILTHRYMAPFRRDALLLGSLELARSRGLEKVCIPMNEISTLVLTVKNSSSVNLELVAITVNEANSSLCSVKAASFTHENMDHSFAKPLARQPTDLSDVSSDQRVSIILPGESFSSLFYVQPVEANSELAVGTVCIKWKRLHDSDVLQFAGTHPLHFSSVLPPTVCKYIPLPALQVEKPLVVATFDCPPQAILGVPFNISLGLQNLTALIQEVDFSVVDSTGFVLSGAHSDSVQILPHSKDVVSCKLVPIVSGLQQLPQFNLIAKRYNAGFQQTLSSIQIFVFPSATKAKPQMLHAS